MNNHTPSPLLCDFETGLLWAKNKDNPTAGLSREAFECGAEIILTREEGDTLDLIAAAYNSFDTAGHALNVDASSLAVSMNIEQFVQFVRIVASYKNDSQGRALELIKHLPSPLNEPISEDGEE